MSLNDARTVFLTTPYPKLTSTCIVDSHIHIMSGRTTPMPLLWNQGLFGKRVFIEWLAASFAMKMFISRNIGRLQKQDILGSKRGPGIAAAVMEQHEKVFHPAKQKNSLFKEYFDTEYLTFMVVLMMDMEYASIDGYWGKMVYYRSKEKTYVYKRRNDDGSFEEKEVRGREKDLFHLWKQQKEQTETAIRNNPWKFLAFYHYDPRRWNHRKNVILDKDLKFGPWDQPFSLLATPERSGLYTGFKMYTPLGYKPDDPELTYLDNYYAKCAQEGIPIIVHCSNGGMFTHDWKYYLDLEKDSSVRNNYIKLESFYKDLNIIFDWERRSRPLDYKKRLPQAIAAHSEAVAFLKKHDCLEGMDGDEIQEHLIRRYELDMEPFDARREYFSDYFIHPRAWRKVLEKHPKLKICFAHFGGDQWAKGDLPDRKGLNCDWIQEIISLIKDYENVYTDISYFNTHIGISGYTDEFKAAIKEFLYKENLSLEKEPHERGRSILDRILWGTDWYMTEIENLHYDDHCSDMKKLCDDNQFEGSWKTLYLRFTMINPLEFFRLGEIADNFGAALKNKLHPRFNSESRANIDGDTLIIKRICSETVNFRRWLNER